ncbi:hypothetical protein ACJX0J_007264, partial [Zea mays]
MTAVRLKWSKEGGLCSQHFVTAPITSLKFLVWFCLLLLSITTLLSFSFIYLCRFRGVTLYTGDNNYMRMNNFDSEGLYTARSNCERGIQNILTGLTGLQLSHGQITDAGMNANLNCYCTTKMEAPVLYIQIQML